MKLLSSIKAWYLRVFLPFEQPDHPLYHDEAAVEAAEAELQEIWDEIEKENMEALLTPPTPEQRRIYKDSMVRMRRERFEEAFPGLDWDSLPKD